MRNISKDDNTKVERNTGGILSLKEASLRKEQLV